MLAAIDILDQTVFELVIANLDLANEDPEAEDRYKNMLFLLRHVGMQLTRDRARLSREVEELRRAPHLIDAVVGLAHRYGQQRRSGQAS